ncbi:MAG: type II toxin-antitoxin system HicA family toxin [Acetobacteraceae bacterium]|nr:type II toxin-antitoxin system HicA family toxin [Acetobacteraceae bacterium]
MTADEVMRRLRREGFTERQGRGAHRVFRKEHLKVIVSAHRGDIPTGTLRQICKRAGWEWPPAR